ncbi:hypothetical protein [Wolbachia endosymbiont of Cantharis cryptica]|uniref:hypothetical protein n=1 Tax=Wolbachia endosymbiont of Cantharis cryptica TaxID=3066132 RepID=UPI00376EABF7
MEKREAISIFNQLLEKDKDFAFNTLDFIADRSISLFRTRFNQLNSQQKEDYKKHLEPKQAAKARFILRLFYPNNERRLRIENSNTGSLDNKSLAQKRKRDDLDEFSEFDPGILEDFYSADSDEFSEVTGTVFLNSLTVKGMVVECGLDSIDLIPERTFVEETHTEPAAKRQREL